jgi:tetratricopeptide (TPR) repeat protein
MRTSEQISTFWSLVREDSADGDRIRRRVAAMGAVALVVCGFLFAIGLGLLALAFLAGLALTIVLALLIAVSPHLGSLGRGTAALGRGTAAGVGAGSRAVRAGSRAAGAAAVPVLRRARGASATALTSARSQGSKLAQTTRTGTAAARSSSAGALAVARARGLPAARNALESGYRTSRELARTARATASLTDPQQEALRLNATGTQLRRDGRPEEAVDHHRRALDILRSLDDRRTVALTQSNLALALSQSGDDEGAIGLFEEAAATLHDLGDEEHEAQIMANLGIAHRRQGRDEEANNVLELALSKLTPASSAYRAIEEQLRRAS